MNPAPLVADFQTVSFRVRCRTERRDWLFALFFVTPGYGERQRRQFHYSQVVKIGNRLETSGQGGWNDDWEFPGPVMDEIAQAFRNVERTLAVAGAGWEHVVHVNSYHVGLDGHQEEIYETMTERFRLHMPDHAPVWTCLGV